jgi:Ca2+-binding EF-hand superfamily protein
MLRTNITLQADMDGDKRIDYLEFLACTMHKNDKVEKDEWLRGAFERFDKERKGYLTMDDVKLHCRLTDAQVKDIFDEVDQNQVSLLTLFSLHTSYFMLGSRRLTRIWLVLTRIAFAWASQQGCASSQTSRLIS